MATVIVLADDGTETLRRSDNVQTWTLGDLSRRMAQRSLAREIALAVETARRIEGRDQMGCGPEHPEYNPEDGEEG